MCSDAEGDVVVLWLAEVAEVVMQTENFGPVLLPPAAGLETST